MKLQMRIYPDINTRWINWMSIMDIICNSKIHN